MSMSKPRVLFLLIAAIVSTGFIEAMAQKFDWDDCQGSAKPYPEPERTVSYPDSLVPVMINHVGRHGARYGASPAHAETLLNLLDDAGRRQTLTPVGEKLRGLVERVMTQSSGRWGQLDSLGMAEQRGIACRMYSNYPDLFRGGVVAESSYVPRCVMSMYEFTHQLAIENPQLVVYAMSGPQYNSQLRFFQDNPIYEKTVDSPEIKQAIGLFEKSTVDMTPLRRVVGSKYPFGPDSIKQAMAEYSFLAGLSAIGMDIDVSDYLTADEYNALWQAFNVKQYLTRTASCLSTVPAEIARPLLDELISTTDSFISNPSGECPVRLRFGHAETLMPLLSLMQLPGCYYPTADMGQVASHWQDFNVVPMAANLQMILFRAPSGQYYLRMDLNERPVSLLPGREYIPWAEAKKILERRV